MSDRPSVLIIDDDEFLCKGLEYALTKLGIRPVLTDEPRAFLAQAKSREFDLYLIDIHLAGGQSGLDLVQSLRTLYGPKARIMIISAAGDPATISRALGCGANDYILKPLDREHLAAKISRYVRTEQMHDFQAHSGSSVSEGRVPGKLSLFGDILEIDEHGVQLAGPHFIPKGTTVWLNGDLFREIAGPTGPRGACLAKVTSTWVESDHGFRYSAYAEFDPVHNDSRWPRALRRWLAKSPN